MKIQFLNGGLANQVFQYIFYQFGQYYHPGDDWFLDDSFFYVENKHNGYELEKVFGLKPRLISQMFDQETWNEVMKFRKQGYDIPTIFTESGTNIDLKISEAKFPYTHPFSGPELELNCNGFEPGITKIDGLNVYYHGYWINKNWFQTYKEFFLKELTFPPILDIKNLEYYNAIKNTNSVGIHIRRGDFVNIGMAIDCDYYRNSCSEFVDDKSNLTFFVFSDDVNWCKENAVDLGLNLAKDTIFVEGNINGKNYIDLQLMTYCKNLIMSNSSFSYLAALLNQNLESFINPTAREV